MLFLGLAVVGVVYSLFGIYTVIRYKKRHNGRKKILVGILLAVCCLVITSNKIPEIKDSRLASVTHLQLLEENDTKYFVSHDKDLGKFIFGYVDENDEPTLSALADNQQVLVIENENVAEATLYVYEGKDNLILVDFLNNKVLFVFVVPIGTFYEVPPSTK